MTATAPFHIIGGPIDAYYAPYGTAFPDIADAPEDFDAAWILLGTDGAKDYHEDGVTIRHSQEIETDAFRTLGVTLPRKASRTSEMVEVEFDMMDLHAAFYAAALNLGLQTVTTTAAGVGTGGNKNFDIERGIRVGQCALLIRGQEISPEATAIANSYNAQLEIANAIQAGESELVFSKDQPAVHKFLFQTLWDSNGTGKVRFQNAAATA